MFNSQRLPHGLERFYDPAIDANAFRFLNRIGAGEWDSAEAFRGIIGTDHDKGGEKLCGHRFVSWENCAPQTDPSGNGICEPGNGRSRDPVSKLHFLGDRKSTRLNSSHRT